ncbi:MAG: 30S ribosomal protein S12 methylthiotransferase RimO [Flavobacteriales bacterium]|nr:30S ribosomal protein S12 methylthiotransferase RimO [Flavobacteriales bacterium]
MRARSHKTNIIDIVTLGCSKNTVDSEVLLTQLQANQFEATHQSGNPDANIIVVNTCGFIDNAKQESIDTILHYIDEKEAGNIEKLFVTGCLSHRYKDELKAEMPEVDDFFGTMELPALLDRLGADYKRNLLGERITTTPFHYAYLKISEGCNRPCSFCAIPLMRGNHVSKPIEQLVREAEHLAAKGVRELMLIAQDTTYYGLDIYNDRKLAELMTQLGDVKGIDWVRLHYAYPSKFPMDVLPVIKNHPSVCSYLDMPLQHSSDHMLKKMRRGITKRRTQELIDQIRVEVPNIALRTTMLVGHPGETQEDFEDLCNFVRENRFERLGVFTYSHEDGTHAYTLTDDVPDELKEERAAELMAIQEEISLELNQKKIGKQMKVLIDRMEGEHFIARSEFDSPEVDNEVIIQDHDNYLRIGDFIQVEITDATEFDLHAKRIDGK